MKTPLISVIIPVYNHQEFIGQAIESVLSQTFPDYEIIVIDDGSIDCTRLIVKNYLRPGMRYVYKNHRGTPSALNVGITKAKGVYISWLSSDDRFLPTKLQKQIQLIQANPNFGMIYTDWYQTDAVGNVVREVHSPPLPTRRQAAIALLKNNCINGSTTLIQAKCFQKAGLFKENYLQGHDHDMWLRLCRYYTFGHIAEPLIYYRRHHKNLSLQPDPLHEFHHKQMFRETRQFFNLS